MMADTDCKFSLQRLKEYHDKYGRHTPAPRYDVQQNGLQFAAVCEYKGFKTAGHGSSKSNAQRDAAFKMIHQLHGITPLEIQTLAIAPIVKLAEQEKEDLYLTSRQIEKINSFVERNKASTEIYNKLKIHEEQLECHLTDICIGMKENHAPKSETLSSGNYRFLDPVECFEKVMEEMQLSFCLELPEINPKKNQQVALIKICFSGIVVGGIGNSKEGAVAKACQNGLTMLRLFIK